MLVHKRRFQKHRHGREVILELDSRAVPVGFAAAQDCCTGVCILELSNLYVARMGNYVPIREAIQHFFYRSYTVLIVIACDVCNATVCVETWSHA